MILTVQIVFTILFGLCVAWYAFLAWCFWYVAKTPEEADEYQKRNNLKTIRTIDFTRLKTEFYVSQASVALMAIAILWIV